jgi:type IV secretory pathway VirB3-like protein
MSRSAVARTALGAGVATVAAAFTGASTELVVVTVTCATIVLILLLVAAAVFSPRDEPMHRLLRLVRALRADSRAAPIQDRRGAGRSSRVRAPSR